MEETLHLHLGSTTEKKNHLDGQTYGLELKMGHTSFLFELKQVFKIYFQKRLVASFA